jgi:[ribosomal protein S5]-alanine N-acetyltransferase
LVFRVKKQEIMYKNIETERLFIRPITINDDAFIFKLVNSAGWLKFIGDREVRNLNDAKKYIENILENNDYFYHVFEAKAEKKPVGIITFLKRKNQEFPDIGFATLPEFQSNGFTYEACKNYLDEIVLETSHSKIIGITMPENTNSIGLLHKLGLSFTANIIENNQKLSIYSLEMDIQTKK